MQLSEIHKILRSKAREKVRMSLAKFVSSSEKVYGVKVPILNEIAKNIQNPDFNLVEELWKSRVFEEKLLATKILGRICKKDPEKTLKLIKNFAPEISDWATCDTLATQGIRKIAKLKQKEIFEFSERYVLSKNLWEKRFGLVLLMNFTKDKTAKEKIKGILEKVKNDKAYYVQKAEKWLKRELSKM